MYIFDPNSIQEGTTDDGFSHIPSPLPSLMAAAGSTTNSQSGFDDSIRLSMEEAAAIEIELQRQLNLDMNNNNNNTSINNNATTTATHDMMQQLIHDQNQMLAFEDHHQQSNWDTSGGVHEMQGGRMDFNHGHNHNHHHHHQQQQQFEQEMHQAIEMQNGHLHHSFNSSSLSENPYPPTADLLNLFHLPRSSVASSLLPNSSSISFAADPNHTNPPLNFHNSLSFLGDLTPSAADSVSAASSVLYDPLYHLNLPPQPPIFRELFQSLPHGYNLSASRDASLLRGGVDDVEGSGIVYQDGDNGVLEFKATMERLGRRRNGKSAKPFTTERERRNHLNDKFKALRDLVPSPTKNDRASVVGDAINYIKELIGTVNELKILVEKKRYGRERRKRQKTQGEEDIVAGGGGDDVESSNNKPLLGRDSEGQYYNGSVRSSWLQRKSKDTEVDVRIIDDDVTIKLAQRRKINCLLLVSKILDELQLDLQHVAGGHIGDYYSFLFNTKIYEGSSVYASAIANKLIEVVDRQYAACMPPTASSF